MIFINTTDLTIYKSFTYPASFNNYHAINLIFDQFLLIPYVDTSNIKKIGIKACGILEIESCPDISMMNIEVPYF